MESLHEYYNLIDKSKWPRGAWDIEPDIVNLWEEESELFCRIIRSTYTGSLNGYVILPNGHKYHGKHYDKININVHGGLTCSCSPDEDFGLYYPDVVYEDIPGRVWYLGFDTAHIRDVMPAMGFFKSIFFKGDTYKNITFVKKELTNLCKQL